MKTKRPKLPKTVLDFNRRNRRISTNDKIVVSNDVLYLYCPACDELHQVPLRPTHRNGWVLMEQPLDHLTETHTIEPEYLRGNGQPAVKVWPSLNHCVHSPTRRGECVWQFSVYYDVDRYTRSYGRELVYGPTLIFRSSSWHRYLPNPYPYVQRLMRVSEWPERYQPIVKALRNANRRK